MVQFKKFIHAKCLRAAMGKAGDSNHTKGVKNAACRYTDIEIFISVFKAVTHWVSKGIWYPGQLLNLPFWLWGANLNSPQN